MKRFLTVTCLLLAVGTGQLQVKASQDRDHLSDHPRVLACHGIPWEQGQRFVARLIWCAARTWEAPGSPSYAVDIARCESGLNPSVVGSGIHGGLFQHVLSAWPGRAAKYLDPLELNDQRWQSAEANTIVAMRMSRADGTWSQQWSCA
jgi:hypothetical protein